MAHFNAVLIGGPPHSGKSVLTYSLTQTLRQQGIDHYVLRACPDGEGDWSNEATPETVRLIRQKGRYTADFVQQVTRDLSRRHLPLLVDVGGRPQPEQEIIFAQCTHAVLVAQDEAGLELWRPIAERNGLSVIAEVISLREGSDALAGAPLAGDAVAGEAVAGASRSLRARLVGLERHHQIKGPVFDALALCVATYLHEPSDPLRRRHLDSAPVELAVDLGALARQLDVLGSPPFWKPQQLPALLEYVPAGVSIGLYGRGPNWLFAALAVHTQDAAFHQFDVRLGWVTPPAIVISSEAGGQASGKGEGDLLALEVRQCAGCQFLAMTAPGYYLDYAECGHIVAPAVSPDQGLVLSGRVPHWLMAGMAVAYRRQPWVAVHQPPLGDQAVVVASRTPGVAVGDLVAADLGARPKAQEGLPAGS